MVESWCLEQSNWNHVDGATLFPPLKISTRVYASLQRVLRPILSLPKRSGAVLSLGLPYLHYLLGKTFPHFARTYDLRVLWTYDVWEPSFPRFEHLIRTAKLDLVLLSSLQATEHFTNRIAGCDVHWLPEFIDPSRYSYKPWSDRTIDVLAFGRQSHAYDERIRQRCRESGLNYVFDPSYESWTQLISALADAKVCVCFPRAITNPDSAGSVSTLTFRYLEAMAARCLIVGNAPSDALKLLGYNPVIEVDWREPAEQIVRIIQDAEFYFPLIERNFAEVNGRFHVKSFVERVNDVVDARLNRNESLV